ncbi:MAG TPA: peptidoglycan recognition family protein [Pseudonocardia sp.]
MVDYLPRSAWKARPPNDGPGNLTVSRVEGAVIHWPGTGSTKVIHTQAAVAAALRGWQNYHMDDRDWSDIAYQVAVDQAGRAWTLRGLHTQSGANGNNDVNERYGAILLVLVTGEEPSEAMKATTRAVIADFRDIYPGGTAIRPHSAVRPDGTDCPGDAARAAIARGDFEPNQEDDEMSQTQYDALMKEIKAARADVRDYALWQVLYGLETEDERAQAQAAFDAARASGKSIAEAKTAAIQVLQSLVDAVKKSQKAS